MTKNIYKTGDQFAEKGTTAWADWQRSLMRHALKDVHFEARQIVQVIRDMCEGEVPAWHLMTRPNGIGFRSFEEFVTSADGLKYPDYAKFRGIAVSEPGILNEREYDLLTKAPVPTPEESGARKGCTVTVHPTKSGSTDRIRSIDRAPALIRKLYIEGLISNELAALLGPDKDRPGYPDRKAKADRALVAIKAIARNGSDADYRKAVNDAVRREFPRPTVSPLEQIRKLWDKLSAKEKRAFLREVSHA